MTHLTTQRIRTPLGYVIAVRGYEHRHQAKCAAPYGFASVVIPQAQGRGVPICTINTMCTNKRRLLALYTRALRLAGLSIVQAYRPHGRATEFST